MKKILLFTVLYFNRVPAGAQGRLAETNNLDGIAIAARRMTVREIMDSVSKNAAANYVDPDTLFLNMACSLHAAGDTPFLAQVPLCIALKAGQYQSYLWNPTAPHIIADHLTTQEQARRIINVSFLEHRNTVQNVQSISAGYRERALYLYQVETAGEDVFYTILIPQKFKSNLLTRMMAAPFKKAHMLNFRRFKIRRRGWLLLEEGYATYQSSPALVKTFLSAKNYRQADSCIAVAQAQPFGRGIVSLEKWKKTDTGWIVDQATLTDNLMRFSSIPFTRNGTTGTEAFTNTYSLVSVPRSFSTDSLKLFSSSDIIPFGRLSDFANSMEKRIEKQDTKQEEKEARKKKE